jgi:hypothetical protein
MLHLPPHELTALDVAALRKCDSLYVWRRNDDSGVIANKRVERNAKDPFASDTARHAIEAPVRLKYDYRYDNSGANCSAHVSQYPTQKCHVSAIFATLRAGDGVAFEFYPDAHTNDYCAAAGLHADLLWMHVYRKGALLATWELGTSICPDNSARMCRGAIAPDFREKAAKGLAGLNC